MRVFLSSLFVVLTSINSFSGDVEVLRFDLKFGLLKGGEATLTIRDTTFGGVRAIQYHITGRTTGITDKLFNVHDVYETTVDAGTNLPLKTVRNIKEQKYRYYNETYFFQDSDSIFSLRHGGMKVPHNLLDIISVFFYFVKNDYTERIDKGELISFTTYHAEKINEIRIKYLGISRVDTDMGKIECFGLAPWVEKGKVLRRSDGLKCFISKDDKIPIQMEFEMRVGNLRAVLRSYSLNGVRILK